MSRAFVPLTKRALALPPPPAPPTTGSPQTGRLARIVRGQGHGYIRMDDDRDVFFDRRSMSEGGFNDLTVGDRMAFELIEDQLSGPRALRVRKLTA